MSTRPKKGSKASRRTKEETQADLRRAALELLDKRGPLAGLSMSEVADVAKVNRVQIYQYFGTREALLISAISEMLGSSEPARRELRKLPFIKRRLAMMDHFITQPKLFELETLLVQHDDEDLDIFPELNFAQESLERDVAEGELPADADLIPAHIMTSAAYKGYCIYRNSAAKSTGIPVEELDIRAREIFRLMLEGIARPRKSEKAD